VGSDVNNRYAGYYTAPSLRATMPILTDSDIASGLASTIGQLTDTVIRFCNDLRDRADHTAQQEAALEDYRKSVTKYHHTILYSMTERPRFMDPSVMTSVNKTGWTSWYANTKGVLALARNEHLPALQHLYKHLHDPSERVKGLELLDTFRFTTKEREKDTILANATETSLNAYEAYLATGYIPTE
jgi:type VI protein secretion system component VasK